MWSHGTSNYWAIVLIIILIVIFLALICWGFVSNCNVRYYYEKDDLWHGPGHYKVLNPRTSDEQDCKSGCDRVDGKLKIVSAKCGILTARFKWMTLDHKYNVTASGETKLQGAADSNGIFYLTEADGSGYAVLQPCGQQVVMVYNEGTPSQFNGKVTMRVVLKKADDCDKYW